MDKWIKKLSGAVIASVLALTLSSKAYANPLESVSDEGSGMVIEEHNTVPASGVKADVNASAAENEKPAAEAAKPAVAEAPKSAAAEDANPTGAEAAKPAGAEEAKPPVADAPKPAGAEEAKPPVADAPKPAGAEEAKPPVADAPKPASVEEAKPPVADAPKPASVEEAKPPVADAPKPASAEEANPFVTVEDTKQNTAEDANLVVVADAKSVVVTDTKGFAGLSDMNTPITLQESSEEEPVRNTPESDDTILLGGPSDSIDSNGDINITASGLNIIGNISTSNGDVNISGTGIILIDSYNFGEDHGFILQPIDGTTAPAVFLRGFSEIYNSDDYVLINDNNHPGILNGQYVIPEGINLIMPENTSIEFVCSETVNTNVESDPVTYGQSFITGSSLTIPDTSTLTVESGATIYMSGKVLSNGTVGRYNNGGIGFVQAPVLNVQGTINGTGTITGSAYIDEKGKQKKGTGIVIIKAGNNSNSNIPSLDSSIFQLEIQQEAGNGKIFHDNTDDELLRYVQEYLIPQSIISNKDYKKLTDGPNRWGPGFSYFIFKFGDNAETILGNSDGANICDDDCNSFNDLRIFQWCIDQSIGGGDSIMMTSTSSTGTGLLGGKNAGAISMILKVTDEESYYNLSAYIEEKQIFALNSKVMVRFDYPVPSAAGQLFVVFRNEDDSLTAFPARYDAITGELVFSGDKLGNFVVVSIDYNGKLYTKEFYDYLETIECVRDLKYGL